MPLITLRELARKYGVTRFALSEMIVRNGGLEAEKYINPNPGGKNQTRIAVYDLEKAIRWCESMALGQSYETRQFGQAIRAQTLANHAAPPKKYRTLTDEDDARRRLNAALRELEERRAIAATADPWEVA